MAVAEGVYFIGTSNVVLTGTIDPAASTTVTGVGTAFLSELGVDAQILVTGETRTITAIASDTSLTVSVAFSDNANDTTPEVIPLYATIVAFEADIADPLTGDLTGLHLAEETATSAKVTFATDVATFLLKLTAASGAEHDGTGYGNGARIAYGAADGMLIDEVSAGDMDNVEISNLAFQGANNLTMIYASDVGDGTGIKINRCLMDGAAASNLTGVRCGTGATNITLTNNIIYDCTIGVQLISFNRIYFVANNTCIKNTTGFWQDHPSSASNTTFKNNLAQENGTDYLNDGGGFGTTAKNISEDGSGPDAAYDNTDVNTNSIFNGYATDDYTLDSAGDATNLAIADDGDDLSGTFTDDIIGQTRSTWYIGASEIVAGGDLVSDSVTLGENTSTAFGQIASALESVTVADAPTANVSTLGDITASALETVTVADSPSLGIGMALVSTVETVTVADTPTVSVSGGNISVSISTSITVGESISFLMDMALVSTVEALTVTDSPTVGIALAPSTSSDVTAAEVVTPAFGFALSASESVTLADSPSINFVILEVSAFETITMGEFVDFSVGEVTIVTWVTQQDASGTWEGQQRADGTWVRQKDS